MKNVFNKALVGLFALSAIFEVQNSLPPVPERAIANSLPPTPDYDLGAKKMVNSLTPTLDMPVRLANSLPPCIENPIKAIANSLPPVPEYGKYRSHC